jgi:hypothetical protein
MIYDQNERNLMELNSLSSQNLIAEGFLMMCVVLSAVFYCLWVGLGRPPAPVGQLPGLRGSKKIVGIMKFV